MKYRKHRHGTGERIVEEVFRYLDYRRKHGNRHARHYYGRGRPHYHHHRRRGGKLSRVIRAIFD